MLSVHEQSRNESLSVVKSLRPSGIFLLCFAPKIFESATTLRGGYSFFVLFLVDSAIESVGSTFLFRSDPNPIASLELNIKYAG